MLESNLIFRYVDDLFFDCYIENSWELKIKMIDIEKSRIKLQIWDQQKGV